MRHLFWMLMAPALTLILAACGSAGGGTVEGCLGGYSGPFSGSEQGNVTGTLRPRGIFLTTFVTSAGAFHTVTATVTDSGSLASSGSRMVVSGSFDLEACTGAGDWTRGSLAGMFSLTKK